MPKPALGGNTYVSGQVSVVASPVLIVAANASRVAVVIKNTGAATVFLGPSNVAITTGHALASGETLTLQTGAAIYGIAAAAGPYVVTYFEQKP